MVAEEIQSKSHGGLKNAFLLFSFFVRLMFSACF